jgi:DeoR family ulaG and ulaABCDEF operon transcriptional repressor
MLESERHRLILKWVHERSIVSVTELVELLEASEATVRRDINALAERGEVRRVRGGAEALHPRHEAHLVGMPFAMSQVINVPQKRAIARAAVELIAPQDSLIINGGTTTFAMAEFLARHELDILTNSFPMAAQLLATSRNRITLPAGRVFREQNIVLSPFTDQDGLCHFWGKKFFTSGYGLNRFGLLEADPLIVQAQARLLERADEVIVLADSNKLRRDSPMVVTKLERISTLITDEGVTEKEVRRFEEAGLRVVVVKVEADTSEKLSA